MMPSKLNNGPGHDGDDDGHTLRLVVVDDHTLFRRGLISLLSADGRFEVVGEAGDAGQAQKLASQCRPQVMLLDNHLPGVRGVDALPALLAAAPGMRVLMLTMSEDEQDLAAALRGGASGYLLKTADADELAHAIVRAAKGQSSFSETMTTKLASAFRSDAGEQRTAAEQAPRRQPVPAGDTEKALATLSPREHQILTHIAAGLSNKDIGRRLHIAETTVKIHVQHILRKLELTSRVQAAVMLASRTKVAGTEAT